MTIEHMVASLFKAVAEASHEKTDHVAGARILRRTLKYDKTEVSDRQIHVAYSKHPNI